MDLFRYRLLAACALASACTGQAATDRIVGPIETTSTVALKGHIHPRAHRQFDGGPLAGSTPISYATLHFRPSPELEFFLDELQNPASPNFHRWLTPEQFGDRFGISTNDAQKIAGWLRAHGLQVHDVARGRLWITFSGTAETVGRAFKTQLRSLNVRGERHYANLTDPQIPASLEGLVEAIDGLHDFEPQPMHVLATPDYNSGTAHYLAPDDIATIYNVAPLYAAGIDGSGQKIAVIGRTAIDLGDIRTFRQRFNLPAKDPQLVLYGPDPGTSSGDVPEADLDLEWSGAVARNATILYVYSNSVRTSAQYAVDQNLAPVMTYSYGSCESENTPALRSIAQQGSAQGITWMVSSGDFGAATCDTSSPIPQASKGAVVSWPASIPEITAVGGTSFNEGGGSYWASINNANSASALSYIPEKVWNDSTTYNSPVGSGGGPSGFFAKPAWQTGPGVPDDQARDVPDVALAASAIHDGYAFNTAGGAHVVGGTSVSSPIFAGVVALLNQYLLKNGKLAQAGLGNINPTLYRLAQSAPNAFHDIVDGDNKVPCGQSSPACVDGLVGFPATPGYDLATGLGSVDTYNLITQWSTASGIATTTVLSASPANPVPTDTVQLTVSVSPSQGPTGIVTFVANDASLGTATVSSGSATLNVNALLLAKGTVAAFYSGDGAYSTSYGSTSLTINFPSGSAVVPAISPYPVYQSGNNWNYVISLTERAGVATKLTNFTIDGVSQNLASWTSTSLAANGTISASLSGSGLKVPLDRKFHFEGTDASGRTWTEDIAFPFVGPAPNALIPAIELTGNSTVQQDPGADSSCQWTQQLTVQEQSGFLVQLTRLTLGTTDLTSNLQSIFGTTRLAPFGMLHGKVCLGGLTPSTRTFTITGLSDIGTTVTATAPTSFQAAASGAATASITPQIVNLAVPDASQIATASLGVSFGGASPKWSASIAPDSRAGKWLTVSPSSGSGGGALTIQADSTGLSKGVYTALISIQSTNTLPQMLTIPVNFVVGEAGSMSISALTNGASFKQVYAPGMLVTVFGSQLAPATGQSSKFPLLLMLDGFSATVNGVSAPLYFISPNQLNLQIPYETGAGPAVLGINNNGKIASYAFTVQPTAPGIFAAGDSSLVPASTGKQGQTVVAFITGDGDLTPTLATGATPAAGTALARLPQPRAGVSVSVGGKNASVAFAGVTNGLAGVTQVNFTIPTDAPLGLQPVVISVGGVASAPVNLTVTKGP